jgi:hypothetical protein
MADDNEQEQEKVEYTKSTATLDLEARLENDNAVPGPARVLNPGYGDVEAGNLYLGTNPEYQNHANDTDAPLQAEDGPERDAEEAALAAYDSRDVKDDAANLEEGETVDAGEGVSPVSTVRAADGQGSPLVVEDPGTGEVPDSEADDEAQGAGYSGGTGQGAPTQVSTPPSQSSGSGTSTNN